PCGLSLRRVRAWIFASRLSPRRKDAACTFIAPGWWFYRCLDRLWTAAHCVWCTRNVGREAVVCRARGIRSLLHSLSRRREGGCWRTDKNDRTPPILRHCPKPISVRVPGSPHAFYCLIRADSGRVRMVDTCRPNDVGYCVLGFLRCGDAACGLHS